MPWPCLISCFVTALQSSVFCVVCVIGSAGEAAHGPTASNAVALLSVLLCDSKSDQRLLCCVRHWECRRGCRQSHCFKCCGLAQCVALCQQIRAASFVLCASLGVQARLHTALLLQMLWPCSVCCFVTANQSSVFCVVCVIGSAGKAAHGHAASTAAHFPLTLSCVLIEPNKWKRRQCCEWSCITSELCAHFSVHDLMCSTVPMAPII